MGEMIQVSPAVLVAYGNRVAIPTIKVLAHVPVETPKKVGCPTRDIVRVLVMFAAFEQRRKQGVVCSEVPSGAATEVKEEGAGLTIVFPL